MSLTTLLSAPCYLHNVIWTNFATNMLEFNRVVVDVIKTAMPNAVTWGRNTGLSSLNRGISMAWKSLRQLGSEAKLQLISTVHI